MTKEDAMRWMAMALLAGWLPSLSWAAGAVGKERDMHEHEAAGGREGRPEAGPPGMRPEIENQAVTVLRIRLAPHQKIPMHRVTARVVVWLTDADLKLTFPDGSTQELRQKAGDAAWVTPQVHSGENLGDGPIEMVAVVPRR